MIFSCSGFGHLSRFCNKGCAPRPAASISFAVFAALVSLFMLVAWFVSEEFAEKACPFAAHLLFIVLVISIATGAVSSGYPNVNSLNNLALFIALLISTLLCVYGWHAWGSSDEEEEEAEEEEDPEVTSGTSTVPNTNEVSASVV